MDTEFVGKASQTCWAVEPEVVQGGEKRLTFKKVVEPLWKSTHRFKANIAKSWRNLSRRNHRLFIPFKHCLPRRCNPTRMWTWPWSHWAAGSGFTFPPNEGSLIWKFAVSFFVTCFGHPPPPRFKKTKRHTEDDNLMRNVQQILGWYFQHTSSKRNGDIYWDHLLFRGVSLRPLLCSELRNPWFQHKRFVFEVVTPNTERISPCHLQRLFKESFGIWSSNHPTQKKKH